MGNVAILILAAGKSSRMGSIKQLLKINSKTLLENTIENALNTESTSIFCVLGANYKLIKDSIKNKNIEIIFNPNYESGLSSSIVCGLEYLENISPNFNAVVVMLADQPEIDSHYLNQLITQHFENPEQIIASSYSGKAGVPAIFPRQFFNALLQLSGDKGAKDFLVKNKSKVITINTKNNIIDIDTLKDYQNFISNK